MEKFAVRDRAADTGATTGQLASSEGLTVGRLQETSSRSAQRHGTTQFAARIRPDQTANLNDRSYRQLPDVRAMQQKGDKSGSSERVTELKELGDAMNRLKLAKETRDTIQSLTDNLPGVTSVTMKRDGLQLKVEINRAKATSVNLNDNQPPLNIDSVELGKDIKMTLARDTSGNMTMSGMDGIKVKGQLSLGSDPSPVEMGLKQASFTKSDGKPALEFSIFRPIVGDGPQNVEKIPIVVRLAPLDKK